MNLEQRGLSGTVANGLVSVQRTLKRKAIRFSGAFDERVVIARDGSSEGADDQGNQLLLSDHGLGFL